MRYILIGLLLLSPTVQTLGQDSTPQEAKSQIEQRGLDLSKSSFVSAVAEGDAELTRLFLTAGLDPNTESRIEGVDVEMSVAEYALSNGHLDILEVLLESGANPNAVGISVGSMTDPLIHSAVDRPEAVKILITHGARVDVLNSAGQTAVHSAIMSDTTAEVRNRSLRVLLNNEADPEARDQKGTLEGATPMLLCAARGRPDAVRILARHGAEVSLEPSGWEAKNGKTIVSIAGQTGNEKTARVMAELREK